MKKQQLAKKLTQIEEEITSLSFDIAHLTTDPNVEIFILKSSLLRDLLSERRTINEELTKYVSYCNHDLLYLLDTFKLTTGDDHYICKCLECEEVIEKQDNLDVIKSKKSFELLKREYDLYKNKGGYYLENKASNSISIYTDENEISKKVLSNKYRKGDL